jgi:hypothetical protein
MSSADTVGDCGHVIPVPPDGIILIRTPHSTSSTGWGYCLKVLPMLADVQKLVG